jgi:tripartite-type tricarboxylate transporter receptor subunit TctC
MCSASNTELLMRRQVLIAGGGALVSPFGWAQAPDWPGKGVRLVVPSGAAGPTDTFARLFADYFAKAFRQPFVIDNKPGANGIIGNDAVAKAPADGHTLLFTYAAAVAVNHALIPKLPYDALKDLQPIAQIGAGGNLLVVTSDFPVKTLREFVDLVKANPNKDNYGSWGVGSGGHLAMEALKMQAGIRLNHVPYKTIPLILNDLIGGQINIGFVDSTTSLVHIRSGKLRPLVCSGTRRGPALPDLPTMTEAGYKFDVDAWFAMFAPAGTPMPIVRRLNEEINRILLLPDMRARFTALNMPEPPVKSVDQFAQTVRDDIVAWGAVIKAADIKPE